MMAKDLMIREVVVAESWEELATVRRKMLELSISYIPAFLNKTGEQADWYLIEDGKLARYFKENSKNSEAPRRQKVGEVVEKLEIRKAEKVVCCKKIEEIFDLIIKEPVLVVDKCETNRLLGILTAFDLLSTIDSIN